MAIILKANLDIDKIDIKIILFRHKFPLFDPLTSFGLSDLEESPMDFLLISILKSK
jgi:hypothetical protein